MVTGAAAAAFRVASGGTMPANSPPTNTRFPASARARARPALACSTSDGLVPQVDRAAEEKNCGAGPLGTTASGCPAGAAGAPRRAAMPTTVARTEAGLPRAAASPKA